MYDNIGGTYSIGLNPNLNAKNGDITNIVPINNIPPKVNKKPDFKTLFKNKIMHDPNQHRRYFLTPSELANPTEMLNKTKGKYDKKQLELQSAYKEDKQFLTLSQNTVDYLKQKDMDFVKSAVSNKHYMDKYYGDWQTRKNRGINDSGTKRLKETYEHFKGQYDETQRNFKSNVADFTRSLVGLEQPLRYEFTDKNGIKREVGVGTGNYNPIQIKNMVDSIFGDVTGDDFIPAVNEERYNQKKETSCCLLSCVETKIYRKKDLPYKESKDYIKDTKEFEEYKKTPDYIPYTPPPSYTEVNPKDFQQSVSTFFNYLQKLDSVLQSPFLAVAEALKPYIDGKLSGTNWSYGIDRGYPEFTFDNTDGLTPEEKQFKDLFKQIYG